MALAELILKKEISFSPSALQLFDECQKKYEYRYIYNMPEPIPASWDAIKLGSFIHKILEEGVKNNIKEEKPSVTPVQAEKEMKSQSEENLNPFVPPETEITSQLNAEYLDAATQTSEEFLISKPKK